jgi:hypothetical protein
MVEVPMMREQTQQAMATRAQRLQTGLGMDDIWDKIDQPDREHLTFKYDYVTEYAQNKARQQQEAQVLAL